MGNNVLRMGSSLPLPTRRRVIAEARDRGRRVVAVLPYHYPRALLRAFGFHPVELWGPPGAARQIAISWWPSCAGWGTPWPPSPATSPTPPPGRRPLPPRAPPTLPWPLCTSAGLAWG